MKKCFARRGILLCLLFVLIAGSVPVEAYAASKTYPYYGNHLTGENKALYNHLKKAWAEGKTNPITTFAYSSSISAAGMWVLNDYPQYFWCNTYSSGFYGGYCTFRMVTWRNAIRKQAAFARRLKNVVSQLKRKSKGKSQAEKAVIIHDWICRNCRYVSAEFDQSAYGVLMKKKAVCAGYARCYKLLCDRMGIKCICVNVYLNGVPHLFNYVKVGGKWYLIDCTNDDQANYPRPLRDFCLAGSRSTGAYLATSCGVFLPDLSDEDYPLKDRTHVLTMSSGFPAVNYSVYDYDDYYDSGYDYGYGYGDGYGYDAA